MAIAAQILRRNHTLRSLKITDNSMGRHGLMALTDAIVHARPPLQEVHMGNLGITSGEEIRGFLRALRAGGAPLRGLDIHGNPLCSPPAPYGGTEEQSVEDLAAEQQAAMAALAELCSWLSAPGNKLERLDMRDAMPGADATDSPAALAQSEAAVSMLCAALASPHCVLEELNVHGFGFTAESVPRLAAPLLRPGCALRKLHLARWPIPLTSLVDESGGLSFGGAAGCVEDMVLVCALIEHGRGGAARTLDLSAVGANLGPAAVDALAGCIARRHLASLTHVSLMDCALKRPQVSEG